ncbi:uncharacterized protein K452DRAFT_245186 [Aplosporella prunicola CBS 121167]|uniref:CRAL-TRIO domain-containing protein n=1 Tax=Aplosporella prunicola CBS 121167 TaxID=1176127 RepID=A0A6A6BJT8_9PEZI|nr:uncharacterized protein K452DRAFT_245186 [Aplosporella prunicola CBS 121167]KAF2144392.1 hypothetical protein K452DRAFT_245186 [Aplosporella prunicola CBS 121167]
MSAADVSRVDSFQYPAAHLGHLTASQQTALDKFKQLAHQAGHYTPATAGAIASHDDETMLRYLRARRFDPQEALKQFVDTENWRKENRLEELYEDMIDIKEYEETRRLYPQWTGRRDKRGIPVYLFEISHLNSKTIAAYETTSKQSSIPNTNVPVKMLRLFALYENLTRFVMPLCSAIPDRAHPETPISQSNNIVDISNVGLKQFWNLKGHMQDASQLATAHYPETLDRIFIIGAPSFFPTVWSWVKRWFDPITVSKIFILSKSNMKETLEQYIDSENIPKKYGGKLDYEFGMMPIIEPAIEKNLAFETPNMQSGKKTIPTGPIRWEENAQGRVEAVAVGSEGGKPRRHVVASLANNTSLKAMHGSTIRGATAPPAAGTAAAQPAPITTSGTHTHAAVDPNAEILQSPTTSATAAGGLATATALPDRTAANDDATRTGTSESRLAGQDGTHAAGHAASGTPHEAVNDHGHGDRTLTVEPNTVGQAPKAGAGEPVGGTEAPAPGYVDQAKEVAEKAYESAAGVAEAAVSAVTGGGKKEEEAAPKEVPRDPRVEGMEKAQVEEFLRGENASTPAGK